MDNKEFINMIKKTIKKENENAFSVLRDRIRSLNDEEMENLIMVLCLNVVVSELFDATFG